MWLAQSVKLARSLLVLDAFAAVACPPLHAQPCHPSEPPPGQVLAHPVVKGSAGPFAQVTLALIRPADKPEAPFTGVLDIGGKTCLKLNGPDEPADFFLIDVKAVLFTHLAGGRGNGIIVLYDSSQIGPDNGTDHEALVYRVDGGAAQRMPDLEKRLSGVQTAAQARERLASVGAR